MSHPPFVETGSGAVIAPATTTVCQAVLSALTSGIAMALDTLRYGVFKPQWVGADPKAKELLPELEKQLLPMRKQATMELYQAGTKMELASCQDNMEGR